MNASNDFTFQSLKLASRVCQLNKTRPENSEVSHFQIYHSGPADPNGVLTDV